MLLATLLLIISLLKFAKSRHAWMDNFKWLALGSIVLTGFPILKKALSALVIKVIILLTHACLLVPEAVPGSA